MDAFCFEGTPPTKRYSSSAVAVDRRVLLYGGTQGGTQVGELWVLEVQPGASRGAWTRPAVGGHAPPGRSAHSACLVHGGRKRPSYCVVFGGEGLHGSLADVAVLQLHARAGPAEGEVLFRATTRAEVDERTEAVTLTTLRVAEPLGPPLALSWVLHVTPPAPARAEGAGDRPPWPAARQAHGAATMFDDSVLVFGGSVNGFELLDDLWRCELGERAASVAWERPAAVGDAPPPSVGHSMSAVGVRALLLGGSLLDAAYVLDATSWAWARLEAGEGVLSRSLHAALPLGRRVLLFGGVDAATDEELSTAASVRLEAGPQGASVAAAPCEIGRRGGARPPPRRSHVCAARVGGSLLFFGGRDGGNRDGRQLGGESLCCVEGEDEAAQRAQDEEELAEEVAAALRARRAQAKGDDKQRRQELAAQAAQTEREAAAVRADEARRAREAADRSLRERGEAAAAALREEGRRKERLAREAKEAFTANRTGGGFKLASEPSPAAKGAPAGKGAFR